MNRDAAILVRISISQWSGRRADAKASATVQSAHHVGSNSGRYVKELLPGNESLAEVARLSRDIRGWQYSVSLPWDNDGWRVIPSARWMEYAAELRAWREKWNAQVNGFIAAYPGLVEAARASLNGLWRESDYPAPHTIGALFGVQHRTQPIPSAADIRLKASDEEIAAVRAETQQQIEASLKAAQADIVQRLRDTLGHMVERLQANGAIFRDSLFANLADLAQLIPRLTIEPDMQLDAITARVAKLAQTDPDIVRDNIRERASVARSANAILDSIVSAYGPAEVAND